MGVSLGTASVGDEPMGTVLECVYIQVCVWPARCFFIGTDTDISRG